MALYSVHEPYSNFNMVVVAKRSLLTDLVGTRLNVLHAMHDHNVISYVLCSRHSVSLTLSIRNV